MTVWDFNDRRNDSNMGTVSFDLKSLAEDGEQPGLLGEVINDGKARGQLRYDVNYFPVLKPAKLADGTLEPVPETTSGVVRLVVHQAKELDPRGQQINPFFRLYLNGHQVHKSQTLKRTPNPIWERPAEFLVTAKQSATIGLQVMDDNTLVSDSKLGACSVRLTDILKANADGNDWFPLSNARSGKVRITAEWKPVLMAGAINGAGAYTAPLGVVRLYFKRSTDLKNVEAPLGKSDPYVRVLHKGLVVARSVVHDNDLDPVYDEIVYVQVHSPKDTFTIEVMDYQHMTKDRSLGLTDFSVEGLLTEGPDRKTKPWVGTGKVARNEALKTDGRRSIKGNIEFEAEFFPCAPLKNVSFAPPESVPGVSGKITEVDEDAESDDDGADEESIAPTVTTTTESFASPPTSPNKQPTPLDGGSSAATSTKKSSKNKDKDSDGVSISREQLLKTQTGVLAFQVISGQLSKKGARLEVLFDDGYWPAFSTERSRSTHNTWDEIGEALIRELDFSRIILKLNDSESASCSSPYSSSSRRELTVLGRCRGHARGHRRVDRGRPQRVPRENARQARDLHAPVPRAWRTSLDRHHHVQVRPRRHADPPARVGQQLWRRPRRAPRRQGPPERRPQRQERPVLRVLVRLCSLSLELSPSRADDARGPCRLNDDRVHKSEVVKKTLAPVWNERFEVQVPSREAAKFIVEVHDWDRVGAPPFPSASHVSSSDDLSHPLQARPTSSAAGRSTYATSSPSRPSSARSPSPTSRTRPSRPAISASASSSAPSSSTARARRRRPSRRAALPARSVAVRWPSEEASSAPVARSARRESVRSARLARLACKVSARSARVSARALAPSARACSASGAAQLEAGTAARRLSPPSRSSPRSVTTQATLSGAPERRASRCSRRTWPSGRLSSAQERPWARLRLPAWVRKAPSPSRSAS